MRAVCDLERTRDDADHCIGQLAARQHGVFSRAQALELGVVAGEIKWRLHTQRWSLIFPKVYRLAGTPETWNQHAMAACLHWEPDAALSHRAAAKIRAIGGLRHARVEITVSRDRNRARCTGIVVHRPVEPIPSQDYTTVDGIPVTKPARTLLDLASMESERWTARFLDDALRRRLVSLSFLERWLADPRRARHRGAPMLRRLVEERATRGLTESPLEARALTLLRQAGLPIPMLQYAVEHAGRFVARLDFAYPEHRVAIEVDGFRYHDTRESFDAERARGNELQAIGWRVLRITSQHLDQFPEDVADWVRRASNEPQAARQS